MLKDIREPARIGAPHIGGDRRVAEARGRDHATVLLVGGSRLLQEAVGQLLGDSRFIIEDCAPDLEQAGQLLGGQPGRFDMLIVQLIDTGEACFFEGLSRLKRLAGERPVVLLAWPVMEPFFVSGSLETGVDGYIESSISQEGLQEALDLVGAGKKVFPPRMQARENHAARRSAKPGALDGFRHPLPTANLSGREMEILRHLAGGRANKVIANELGITEATVKVHVKGVLRKIGAENRTQAAIWALHNGLQPIYTSHEAAEGA